MKIVNWNCNMAFRRKYKRIIEIFNPDIMVIQECEEPDKLISLLDEGYDILWIGDDENKGLSIITKNYLKTKRISLDDETIYYMLLIQVIGKFKISAFWGTDVGKDPGKRFIGQVWAGLNKYIDDLDENTLVLGDFNWNLKCDEDNPKPVHGNLTDVINLLDLYHIESSYHYLRDKEFGEEINNTLYMQKEQDKACHTDYMFIPTEILEKAKNFEIGKYDEWIEYSDHMPLFIEF